MSPRRPTSWRTAWNVTFQAFGVRGLIRRAFYLALLKSGVYRLALPVRSNFDCYRERPWAFRFDLDSVRNGYCRVRQEFTTEQQSTSGADRILRGNLRFYGGQERSVSWPPDWHRDTLQSGIDPRRHWSEVTDKPSGVDIKDIWEPSRFGFTYPLVREFVITDDEHYCEQWWRALESWCQSNPPNSGPNWRCGQEVALRGITVCFALSAFAEADSSTPGRLKLAHRFLEASYSRVRKTLIYGLSQRNNHAISELCFLLTLTERTSHLERLLREVLNDQWYPDGSYSQQSFIYQRLALHALVWLLHVRRDLEEATLACVREKLALSAAFIERCVDPITGRLPNFGSNDGAILFDLDETDRWDARPTLAALGRHQPTNRFSKLATWFPPERLELPVLSPTATTSHVTLSGRRSRLITHIGAAERHRQGHEDQQSIELSIDGEPIVLDPGTYRYTAPEAWQQPFVAAQSHSIPLPLDRPTQWSGGRFLRERMPTAHLVEHTLSEWEVVASRRQDGLQLFTRTVLRRDDSFIVVDEVSVGEAQVRWLLNAAPERSSSNDPLYLDFLTAHGSFHGGLEKTVVERSPDDPLSGWWSPIYGELKPATVVTVQIDDEHPSIACFQPLGTNILDTTALTQVLNSHLPRLTLRGSSPHSSHEKVAL